MRCYIPIGKRGPVKLTIVTHLSFSERLAIANLSYKVRYTARGGLARGTRLRCGYRWLRPGCMIILTNRFTRRIAGPGLSLHRNAVRMDDSGNGRDLCCRVSSTCLQTHSKFVTFTHRVKRVDSWSVLQSRASLAFQRSPLLRGIV